MHAGEKGVKVLKTFLLGGQVDDPACTPQLDQIFDTARAHGLVVHVHTSTGGASDIDQIGALVDRYGDEVKIHLVHLGGGVSAHIKLIGHRFFDWIGAGKQVHTDTSWAVGFAPRWLAQEIERRGVGQDRLLFASDEPWGDYVGELAHLQAATGDGELGRMVLRDNFTALYGSPTPLPATRYVAGDRQAKAHSPAASGRVSTSQVHLPSEQSRAKEFARTT